MSTSREPHALFESLVADATMAASSHNTQPWHFEIGALRSQFAAWLGVGSKRPDLVVRFGYGPETPRALRRPVADVLVTATRQDT